MVISGANNLRNNKSAVDRLNVFPVPDGDTGTNMSLTLIAAANEISKYISPAIGEVASVLANASLRGARGNSGVILSQFCRGIAKSLETKQTANAQDFAVALKLGVTTAYKAVMRPTEGTILTVAREAADAAVEISSHTTDIVKAMEKTIAAAKASLEHTPELLPVLKEAGVVDAGGMGLLVVYEGVYQALLGSPVALQDKAAADAPQQPDLGVIDTDDIKFAYCTEFIIDKKSSKVNVKRFSDTIDAKGDSRLVIDDEAIVKVHIHTNNPGFVIEEALKLGSLSSIKIDNMKIQHRSIINNTATEEPKAPAIPSTPPKSFGFVVVSAGSGLSDIFRDLGADKIIEGGQTMNPSTESILEAVESIHAKCIFVLPNNKNIVLAAQQAVDLTTKNMIVLPTKSIPQGISAMLAFNPADEIEENRENMTEAISTVKTGQVTYAVRDTSVGDKTIKEGDIIGINDEGINIVGHQPDEVCGQLIANMVDKDDSIISIFYGADVSEESAEKLAGSLQESYPDMDVVVKSGGQPLYYYIVAVE